MHTFFINTSKKTLDDYEILTDIYRENQNLVAITCPIGEWHDPNKGYVECARVMGEMIDGYVEINNEYNLILYIDLAEIDTCPPIQRNENYETERTAHVEALRRIYSHMMSATIIAALNEAGRTPKNVLIMFGRDKIFVREDDEEKTADQLHEEKTNDAEVRLAQIRLFGLADIEKITKAVEGIVTSKGSDEEQKSALQDQLPAICGCETVTGLRKYYAEELKTWCCKVIEYKSVSDENISSANEDLCGRLDTVYKNEGEREHIWSVICPYDTYACTVNKSELALSRLNIAIHLLKCVERNSIFDDWKPSDASRPRPLPFYDYSLEEIAPLLRERERVYSTMGKMVSDSSYQYSKLGLVPKLQPFDHGKFGLDKYGGREIVSSDAQTRGAGTALPLLKENEFNPMDESDLDVTPSKNSTPEQYKNSAEQVKAKHLNYLRDLKNHVIEALSNYAHFGEDHRAPVLGTGGFKYADAEKQGQPSPVGVAKETSQRAYETVLNRYAEFCAGRSVAVTNVEEQCEWFKDRVDQIEKSLKRLCSVAVCMAVALLVLYIPFVVIQFEFIVQNVVTLAVAMASMAVPLILLLAVFTVLSIMQRKKYAEAWDDFKNKSQEAITENRQAAADFDYLLATAIPALRWVYEYKLDVAYCEECGYVAAAKIEHHLIKLRERAETIRNMLSDLENRPYEDGQTDQDPKAGTDNAKDPKAGTANVKDLDLSRSFCMGKNKDFYMILDTNLLGLIEGKEHKRI